MGALLPERWKGQLAMPSFPCLGSRFRAGPFLSLFPGNALFKDWGKCEECLFHACLCYACIPSMVLGSPGPSQASLLGTGRGGRCSQNPVLSIFQGNVSICQILVP